jgi:hypothetical protein
MNEWASASRIRILRDSTTIRDTSRDLILHGVEYREVSVDGPFLVSVVDEVFDWLYQLSNLSSPAQPRRLTLDVNISCDYNGDYAAPAVLFRGPESCRAVLRMKDRLVNVRL